MTNPYDGLIRELGEKLYRSKAKGRKAKTVRLPGGRKVAAPPKPPIPRLSTRQKIAGAARKSPEVMVKISGGGKNRKSVKDHHDYISRNGKVELENEQGEVLKGRDAVREGVDDWADVQQLENGSYYRMPANAKTGTKREAFNIVLSMPPGTDRQAVKDAARAFAATAFSGHKYVMAAHDDEKHPHVHVCVRAMSDHGVRLNPRKADLQEWREGFAVELQKRGIDATATKRAVRGKTRKAARQSVRHLERREGQSRTQRARFQEAKADAASNAPPRPGDKALAAQRRSVLEHYGQLAVALAKGDDKDRQLAVDVTTIVRNMEPPQSGHAQAVEHLRGGKAGGIESGQIEPAKTPDPDKGKAR